MQSSLIFFFLLVFVLMNGFTMYSKVISNSQPPFLSLSNATTHDRNYLVKFYPYSMSLKVQYISFDDF